MTSPILVTGGTGLLGRLVTPLLRDAGHDLRVLSRHHHEAESGIEYVNCDLLKGEGIDPAVDGVETLLHLAGGTKGDAEATQNLTRAASRAGVKHIIYISVIGADKMPLGYFKMKYGAEKAVSESGLPWTTIRAAQVHDLVLKIVGGMAKMPVVPIPGGLRFQPVDAAEVSTRLAELTLGKPAGLVPDIAGPKVYGMNELVPAYLQARGKKRMKMPVRVPGKAGKAYRAGENLNLDTAEVGKRTWEDFLTERVSTS
ncbi:NAD(P)H-binding protein [Streptomyces sp. N2-109]|uniref:NAD(P)H-binding protein n=1 Tax=Streptomyces gossypii TaxID=2883101 RepID=A0ABT2K043_9ACTN|nr:NAD(P)H-binding protein [Streptomyces gossypii]MCT2592824.1 NAD(P)H-binding protein [Streptomyces gossypii]